MKQNIRQRLKGNHLDVYRNPTKEETAPEGTPKIGMTFSELRCLGGRSMIFSNTGDADA